MDVLTTASMFGVIGPGSAAAPVRLGEGRLVHPSVVVAQGDLARRLADEPSPTVRLAAVAAVVGGRLLVDAVEVLGVHRSRPGVATSWAVEMRRPVALPASTVERPAVVLGDLRDVGFQGRTTDPVGLICFLFRGLRICRGRDADPPGSDPPDR